MRRALILHPDSRCDAVRAIEAEVAWAGSRQLCVRYRVQGDLEGLKLPPAAKAERTDELWRRTCLEIFVQDAEGEGYVEFNLSPSSQWAAYRFDGYRRGMRAWDTVPPDIEVARTSEGLELRAILGLPHAASRFGLSAVIEEVSGRVSYWALRHPAGKADFHHADGFALELPAPSPP